MAHRYDKMPNPNSPELQPVERLWSLVDEPLALRQLMTSRKF
jgi:hypothetical protein